MTPSHFLGRTSKKKHPVYQREGKRYNLHEKSAVWIDDKTVCLWTFVANLLEIIARDLTSYFDIIEMIDVNLLDHKLLPFSIQSLSVHSPQLKSS